VRRLQTVEAALLDQPGDVRQPALCDPSLEQPGIHPVESEDYQFLGVRAGLARRTARDGGEQDEDGKGEKPSRQLAIQERP
jgi:hypothetical protein